MFLQPVTLTGVERAGTVTLTLVAGVGVENKDNRILRNDFF